MWLPFLHSPRACDARVTDGAAEQPAHGDGCANDHIAWVEFAADIGNAFGAAFGKPQQRQNLRWKFIQGCHRIASGGLALRHLAGAIC